MSVLVVASPEDASLTAFALSTLDYYLVYCYRYWVFVIVITTIAVVALFLTLSVNVIVCKHIFLAN